jgi:type IX secretion system PorP/SprF family membrane protein
MNYIIMYMTKTIRKALLVLLILSSSLLSVGQRDPMYTQYIFNMQTINPAYAGTWQSIGFIALTRLQWVGISGAPTTQTFSIQTPFKSENVGLGLNIVHDQIGMENRLLVNVDYSYRLSISDASSLRFGIKGGFTNYSNPLGLYTTYTLGDPNFQGYIDNKFMPNVGVGAFLYSSRYYLGLSVPKLVETQFKTNENGNYVSTQLSELRELYASGGLVFDLSANVKFKPTFIAKYVQQAPFQYDLSANFLFGEKVWLGAMYRSGDAIGVIAQWIIQNRFRIGYSADFSTTDIARYHKGVHEIMVSYEIDWHKFISPRYF